LITLVAREGKLKMVSFNTDPEEFVGGDQSIPAAPKSKTLVSPRSPPVAPAPRVAVYNPPAAGASHPKHAVLGPALRLDEAEANLSAAQLEFRNATLALRSCELIEAEALTEFVKVMPGPTFDEVNRQRLAAEQAAKMARVQAGLSPTPPKVPTHGNSPIDIAAANRPRTSQAMPAGGPLRSNVVRRSV
jgi:hypothetical protein